MVQPTKVEEDPLVRRCRERVGAVLQDKWRLDSLIGVGGMAAVYAATHRNNKRVAVKMLHGEYSGDADVRSRFLQEGYAANIVDHPGAVSVLDDDVTADGEAFLVMELLEGETLEQRWARKGERLPLLEVLELTDQLLDVLAAAHAKAIVHRDIKPENLFLTRAGTLKVLDFGIARIFESHHQKQTTTRAGTVMGTPAFMAPEQARARWDEVDGRTDLWAVGATAFTLLSGQHVHVGETGNEQLILSATAPARSLASVVSGLPRSVIATVDRALAFERERRWSDARAMQEAVRGSLEALRGADGAAAVSGTRSRLSAPSHETGGATVVTSASPAREPADLGKTELASQVSAWTQERDLRSTEVTNLRPAVTELQQRRALAKRRVAEAEERLAHAQGERATLDQWFQRQMGTRAAAAEEARRLVRSHQVALAKRVAADRALFGAPFDASRAEMERLERAAVARAHDVTLHELALSAHDRRTYHRGIAVAALATIILFLALAIPVVLRIVLPADPPQLTPTTTDAPPK